MNFHSDEWIMNNVQCHYNEAISLQGENKVAGVFAQGSQNYGLDYFGSDIDTKCMVLPSFEDIVLGKKMTSTTHIRKNEEHIDCKDIRVMFNTFKKQNINFLEILFTKYFVLNPYYEKEILELMTHKEDIAHWNNFAAVNCIAGASLEKYKALEHPYPTIADRIEKYGFDRKQLHHIIRFNEFIKRYIAGESFEDCLISKKADYLVKVKADPEFIKLNEARVMAKELSEETYQIKQEYMESVGLRESQTAEKSLQNCLVAILKKSLKKEIV